MFLGYNIKIDIWGVNSIEDLARQQDIPAVNWAPGKKQRRLRLEFWRSCMHTCIQALQSRSPAIPHLHSHVQTLPTTHTSHIHKHHSLTINHIHSTSPSHFLIARLHSSFASCGKSRTRCAPPPEFALPFSLPSQLALTLSLSSRV